MKLILKADKELETEFYFKGILAQTLAQSKTTTTTLKKILTKQILKKLKFIKLTGKTNQIKAKKKQQTETRKKNSRKNIF